MTRKHVKIFKWITKKKKKEKTKLVIIGLVTEKNQEIGLCNVIEEDQSRKLKTIAEVVWGGTCRWVLNIQVMLSLSLSPKGETLSLEPNQME